MIKMKCVKKGYLDKNVFNEYEMCFTFSHFITLLLYIIIYFTMCIIATVILQTCIYYVRQFPHPMVLPVIGFTEK